MKISLKNQLALIIGVEPLELNLSDEELLEVLKRRLTKKEKKLLFCQMDGLSDSEIAKSLKIDEKRREEIKEALYTKLKHPKTRNEIVC